ncbi:CAAX prenyl protease 2 isoform X3 [Malania oleifera]|uniref:CAAX prenyl protease 2 isoform X3 n=1 Tax=Malania oleifera TaxID=397392 RepID=UPI0025ADDBB1|nr:CAAX prenyl protease 2 isoform X3 [Malania oleifera]
MEMTEEVGVSKSVAVFACTAMAFFYVTILYAPTVLLRLPRPTSFKQFLIRRFFCAAISSVFSFLFSALILPVKRWEPSYLLGVYGMRLDHLWQAVVFPLSLTSLMYAGSLVVKYLLLVNLWKEYKNHGGGTLFDCIRRVPQKLLGWIFSLASNVVAWRNYVVAPITEELVFRACMIPLLLCGGFRIYTVIFLCPVFFSLAHLNHFFELYGQQNRSLLRASMVVGHLLAPVVAHIFCNMMGLPVLFSRRNGIIVVAFVAGMVGFLWLLFPVTSPNLYNARTDNCRCWPGHCLH